MTVLGYPRLMEGRTCSSAAGHGVCSSSRWVNGYLWYDMTGSYHPNRAGHASGYTPLLRQIIG